MQSSAPHGAGGPGGGVPFRCGSVAVVGSPNAGKSTLMNAFVGRKLSIVTPKPQTTRHMILGICTGEDHQIVFLDTPGLLTPTYLLQSWMMKAVDAALAEADLVLFLLDAAGPAAPREAEEESKRLLDRPGGTVLVALNKIDLLPGGDAQVAAASCARRFPMSPVFPVSALRGTGMDDLRSAIIAALPEHPALYPDDIASSLPERFFVAELIREKVFEQLREEVPYATAVDVTEFLEREGRKDLIRADIVVERESQKGIVIGKRGAALKEIGSLARREIEEFLGRPVFLELHVKVRGRWRNEEAWLKRFGYTS